MTKKNDQKRLTKRTTKKDYPKRQTRITNKKKEEEKL